MATIIVHGTMTFWKAHRYTWWWNSFHPGGFCQALAEGMLAGGRQSDIWKVGGVPVSQIPELARNPRKANMITHEGHYEWTGANMDSAREAGGKFLAYYLNGIAMVAPGEPIDVVAHSHGGNVVKIATMAPHLDRAVRLRNVVLLACPHWASALPHGQPFPYRLNRARIGRALNLYSEEDIVQLKLAAGLPGPWGARLEANVPTGGRIDPDQDVRSLYEDYHVVTKVGGERAHEVMHGASMGHLVGAWLAGNGRWPFRTLAARLKLPVPIADSGNGA